MAQGKAIAGSIKVFAGVVAGEVMLAFGGLVLMGPLAFVLLVVPALLVLGFLTLAVHGFRKLFAGAEVGERWSKSLALALFMQAAVAGIGYWIWESAWAASPYYGP